MKIQDSDITVENIDRLIQSFGTEYGVYDEVLIRLFENADNMNHDNIFCRVGLLDLIYSTAWIHLTQQKHFQKRPVRGSMM